MTVRQGLLIVGVSAALYVLGISLAIVADGALALAAGLGIAIAASAGIGTGVAWLLVAPIVGRWQ